MTVNSKLERNWKHVVMAQLDVLSKKFAWRDRKSRKIYEIIGVSGDIQTAYVQNECVNAMYRVVYLAACFAF
jgi:hypothetical protein